MVHGATSMGLLRIEDRVFIGCVVAEWARSENKTFLGPLLQFSEFRVQSRSYVVYVFCNNFPNFHSRSTNPTTRSHIRPPAVRIFRPFPVPSSDLRNRRTDQRNTARNSRVRHRVITPCQSRRSCGSCGRCKGQHGHQDTFQDR